MKKLYEAPSCKVFAITTQYMIALSGPDAVNSEVSDESSILGREGGDWFSED